MATSTDLQQALALRKANPALTTADAVAQVRSSALPAPVIKDSQTDIDAGRVLTKQNYEVGMPQGMNSVDYSSINHTVNDLGGNTENRQNTRNVVTGQGGTRTPNGAIMNADGSITTAPVAPTTPVATTPPVAPVTTPPVVTPPVATTTPVKPTVPIDYNASQGREGEIQKNVTDITTANPALLKDRNAYNQAFGYATADQGKKAMLDSSFTGGQPIAMGADQTFQALRAGQPIQNQNTPEYRTANARLNTFKRFTIMDPATLSSAINSGVLLSGTTSYNDLLSDPVMAIKLQKATAFLTGKIDEVKVGTNQAAVVLSNNPTVANAMADGTMTQTEYNSLTNNEAVIAQGKAMEEKKNKYEKIKAIYDNVETEVNTEFTGKETTDSFKGKIVADRRKGMYKDYQIAMDEYNNSMGTYTNLKADSTALLNLNMDNYKTQQANNAQIASEQRKVQSEKDMFQYESDFKKKQAQEALSDPATQIQSTMDEFAKMGIVAQGNTASKIAEFKTSGKSLPDYISGLRSQFMSKPEYKKAMELKSGQLSDAQKLQMGQSFDLTKMGIANQNSVQIKQMELDQGMYVPDGMGGILNKHTGNVSYGDTTNSNIGVSDFRSLASQYPNEASLKNNNPAGLTWNNNFDTSNGFAKILIDNGVNFTKGTNRPTNEGGSYVQFPTVQDGMKAYSLLWKQPQYQNMTVQSALNKWGTGALNLGNINPSVTIASLNTQQLQQLQSQQLKKESPGFYNELTKSSQAQQETPLTTEGGNDITNAIQKAGLHDTPLTREAYNVANYNAPLTARLKNNMPLMNAVSLLNKDGAYDPTFYDQKLKAMKDLTPAGYIGRSVGAFNTALHHLDGLNDVYSNASNGNLPWINRPINQLKGIIGDPKVQAYVTEFNTMKSAVQDEVAKAFKGGVLNQSDVEQINTIFDSNSTPAQMSGFTDAVSKLLGGKLSSMMQQYQPYFRDNKIDRSKFITPSGESALNKLGYKINDNDYTIEKGGQSNTAPTSNDPFGIR